MLTDGANGANGAPRAVMLTLGEIAQRDGVAKPTVSIAVKRLVERHNLTVERDAQGRVARVNAAEYDVLRGRFGDPSKAQAPKAEASAKPVPAGETYDEALRQKTWHEAEKRRYELDELKGRLVSIVQVRADGREAINLMRSAFERATQDAAERLALATGVEARTIRPHLRQLQEQALEEFRRSLATALRLDAEDAGDA